VDISAVLLSIVAAVGTLTPLTLGILSHVKDKKKSVEQPAIPATAMGETVDFESIAVQSLNAQIKLLQNQCSDRDARVAELKAQRDANARELRAHGLQIPDVSLPTPKGTDPAP
jgi:predicted FMN-binding regulatory protein PaiB